MGTIKAPLEVWSMLNGIFKHYPEVITLKSEEESRDAHIEMHLVRNADGSIQRLKDGMVESCYKYVPAKEKE